MPTNKGYLAPLWKGIMNYQAGEDNAESDQEVRSHPAKSITIVLKPVDDNSADIPRPVLN